jgi:hypothetical protein
MYVPESCPDFVLLPLPLPAACLKRKHAKYAYKNKIGLKVHKKSN